MSRSPTNSVSASTAKDYLQAWDTLHRMQRAGQPLSGHERHCAFLNSGGGRFLNVSAVSGFDLDDDGRGLALCDWDHDGDLDMWLTNRTSPLVRFLRNNGHTENHFLALRLVGKECNRDAIGARVELEVSVPNPTSKIQNPKSVQSVRAGHGFHSQSSKWLHFGLGDATRVKQLTVRWPGGGQQTFENLAADRWYELEQGERPRPWSPPDRKLRLAAEPVEGRRPTEAGRIVLVARAPIPPLSYENFSGEGMQLPGGPPGPTLLNLWASWCVPCHAELKDLSDHSTTLQKAGLRVVALSVDGLDEAKATNADDAEAFVQQMDFAFESGMASTRLLERLQLLHDAMFARDVPLAVPTSFLIDADGELAVIYRGPVSADQLLQDVQQLSLAPAARRRLAAPFKGRWFAPPPQLDTVALAEQFDAVGLRKDAIALLKRSVLKNPQSADSHATLGLYLMEGGDAEAALRILGEAVRLDPDRVAARNNLGNLLKSLGRGAEAIEHYRAALRVEPHNAEVLNNMGAVLEQAGQLDTAIDHFQRAVKLMPDSAQVQFNLGDALIKKRKHKEAEEHLAQAVRLAPDLVRAHVSLGRMLAMTGRMDDALSHFRKAVQQEADQVESHMAIASILLARDPRSDRDTAAALVAARSAAELTSHEQPIVLDVLAAACAASGRLDEAIAIAKKALVQAQAAGNGQLSQHLRRQLAAYQKAKENAARRSDGD